MSEGPVNAVRAALSAEPVPEVLRRAIPREASWDFEHFLRQGIARAQEVSGDVWTDYNEHDPGVTILEQFCFALTDLAYRTGHPMDDLLASVPDDDGADKAASPKGEGAAQWFHPSAALLSTSPITVDDLRRSVLGQFREVRNVWIRQHPGGRERDPLSFEVLLQKSGDPADQKAGLPDWELEEAVWKLLQTEACLGMRFQRPQILPDQTLQFFCEVFVDEAAGGDPASLTARLLYAVDEAINPQPRMISYRDLLDRKEPPSPIDIYDGPLTPHGYVYLSATHPWPKTPDADEIRAALMHTAGVHSVSGLEIQRSAQPMTSGAGGGSAAAYSLPVTPEGLAGVSIVQGGHRLLSAANASGPEVSAFFAEVQRRVTHRRRQFRFAGPSLGGTWRTVAAPAAPTGKRRPGLSVYRSVQHLFPAIYGLGVYGDPTVNVSGHQLSPEQREAARAQLQAYLLLLEQFLANYLAQLANAPRLLSWREPLCQTYFVQPVPSLFQTGIGTEVQEPPGSVDVLAPGPDGSSQDTKLANFCKELAAVNDQFDPDTDRMERAYNHLLARVNERFSDPVLAGLSNYRKAENAGTQANLNVRKREFLARYNVLGTRRAASSQLLAGDKNRDGIVRDRDIAESWFHERPALAARIELSAGLTKCSVRLVDHAQLGPDPGDGGIGELMIWPTSEEERLNFPAFRVGPASIALPLSKNGSLPPALLLIRPEARSHLVQSLATGELLVEADPGRRGGRFGISVWEEEADGSRNLLARSLNVTASLAEAEDLARSTADALGQIVSTDEEWRHPRGFNSFPARFSDRRLTMIVPEEEGPTQSVRDFVERTFREEAPAHLTLDVFWVDIGSLDIADKGLRELYRWQNGAQAAVLRRMIEQRYFLHLFEEAGSGTAS